MKALNISKMKGQPNWWGELEGGGNFYIKGTINGTAIYRFPPKLEGETDDDQRRKAETILFVEERGMNKGKIDRAWAIDQLEKNGIDMSIILKRNTDVCYNCGKPAYKSDSKNWICRNLAEHGSCTYEGGKGSEPRRVNKPYGRNDLCPCGSGKKYKHCHLGQNLVIEKKATDGK